MTDEEIDARARNFVTEFKVEIPIDPPSDNQGGEINIGLIVAHSALPVALSAPVSAVVRYGISVSVGTLIGHGLAAVPTAKLLESAFSKIGGKPIRLLRYEDAAVLDWCWRNSQLDQISQGEVVSSAGLIQREYGLQPAFDEQRLVGCLEVLERNKSIISKPTGHWRLVEKVTLVG